MDGSIRRSWLMVPSDDVRKLNKRPPPQLMSSYSI